MNRLVEIVKANRTATVVLLVMVLLVALDWAQIVDMPVFGR